MRNSIKRIIIAVLLAFLCVLAANAQNINVKGKVTDSGNIPLIGVGVFIEGTATGTVTGADGTWAISGIPSDAQVPSAPVTVPEHSPASAMLPGRSTLRANP